MSQLLLNLNTLESIQSSDNTPVCGRKSIRSANRSQIEFKIGSLDSLIPEDHRVRDVWEFVQKMDLSEFYSDIKISENSRGPRTADPKIYLALWLYATLEGIASARHINRLCVEHHAYIWICGGVSVNYHSISDFRTQHSDKFRKLLQESIACIWKTGMFSPEEAAQDGTRVKTNAGSRSFRREATLKQYLEEANELIERLEKEHKVNPSAYSQREKSAKEKVARERKERLEQALSEMQNYKESKVKSSKENHNKFTKEDKDNLRVSMTDPESRKMKMGDGGFRAAFNIQFTTSTKGKVILGVDVVNTLDPGTLTPMIRQVQTTLEKIGCPPVTKWLADSAYSNKKDVDACEEAFPNLNLYSPPVSNTKADPLLLKESDSSAMKNLKQRMRTSEGQEVYKKRSSTAEFSNAQVKNKGMQEFLVRGTSKVLSMALIYALAHNMERFWSMC